MRVMVGRLHSLRLPFPCGALILSLLLLLLSGPGCSGSTGDDDSAGDDDDTSSQPTPVDADQDGATADVDCDDNDPDIHPGADEHCDGVDEDCDLALDDAPVDARSFFADEDGDGFGAGSAQGEGCVPPAGQVANDEDCDDEDDQIHPDADETCDGVDEDCDDKIDDGVAGTWYKDYDEDGYGNPENVKTSCDEPEGYVDNKGDCDDTEPAVHTGADEVCNGIDDDCDGRQDENTESTWYKDYDGDGYGDPAVSSEACPAPAGFVADHSDCDDADDSSHPGATETCDGVDEDCDGEIDDGFDRTPFHPDADGDGFGAKEATVSACVQPEGHVTDGTDCDDSSSSTYPGAAELCNSADDDCDGGIDEDVVDQTFYRDEDGDGYGTSEGVTIDCAPPDGYVLNSGDCDDGNAAIHPDASEVCNGIDDNCSGAADETGENTFYRDGDADGYGNPADTIQACKRPSGYVMSSTDCDDANAAIHPGADEVCNFADDNCDGTVDEGLTIDRLSAGESHSLALCSDGTVLAWGFNGSGQLGDGTFDNRSKPVPVKGLTKVVAIAAGPQHSLAVREDGTAWAWGYNGSGQLGDATRTSRNLPSQVKLQDDPKDPDDVIIYLADVVDVAGGAEHSLFQKEDGTVWAVGSNYAGQLGNGSTVDSRLPVAVSGLTGVTSIAAGASHSLAVDGKGQLYAWGDNSYGQLGASTASMESKPIEVSSLAAVTAAAAGFYHSLALGTDGVVYAWGRNDNGQLGDGTEEKRGTPGKVLSLEGVAQIAAGFHHNLAALEDGTVFSWGANFEGQLGVETRTSCGYDAEHPEWARPCSTTPLEVGGVTAVSVLAGGYLHSMAVDGGSGVWTWGANAAGQLGNGSTASHTDPKQIN